MEEFVGEIDATYSRVMSYVKGAHLPNETDLSQHSSNETDPSQ